MLRSSLFVVLVVLSGCGGLIGNGKVIADTRTVSMFTQVEASTALDVELKLGELSGVELTGDSNLVSEVLVSVESGRLHIGFKPFTSVLSFTNPVKAVVSVPRLDFIKATGAVNVTAFELESASDVTISSEGSSNVKVAGARAPAIHLSLSGSSDVTVAGQTRGEVDAKTEGSSDLKIERIEAVTADLQSSGSSDLHVAGTVTNGTLRSEGSSGIVASDVAFQSADIEAQGASNVSAQVSGDLKVRSQGSSAVTIIGQPATRDVKSEGSSSVKFR